MGGLGLDVDGFGFSVQTTKPYWGLVHARTSLLLAGQIADLASHLGTNSEGDLASAYICGSYVRRMP